MSSLLGPAATRAWYHAPEVDAWAAQANEKVECLRAALNDTARQARDVEAQLRLLTLAHENITSAAERAMAAVARLGAASDSALARQTLQRGHELVSESRRGALAMLAESRRSIVDLYRDAGTGRLRPLGAATPGDDAVTEATFPPLPAAGVERPPQRMYQAEEAERYMHGLDAAIARLTSLLAEAKQRTEQASAHLEGDLPSGPFRSPNGTANSVSDGHGRGLAVAAAPADASGEDPAIQAHRVLAGAIQGSHQILSVAQTVVSALYVQAEADLLGEPPDVVSDAREQSA